jgi:hypothetical protein
MGGRGRSSGVGVEAQSALLFTVRDGLVVHIQGYSDPREALKAVGLEE